MIPAKMDAWCRARCAPLVVPPAAQVTTRLHHFRLFSLQKRLSSRKNAQNQNTRNILLLGWMLGCWEADRTGTS